MAVTVTMRIFSGRPNPTWTLSEREERDLVNRLSAATPRQGLVRYSIGGLGYHGFWVEATPYTGGDLLSSPIAVYGGTIDFGEASVTRVDQDRQLERWLLTLQPSIEGRTLTRARREFDTIYRDPDCSGQTPSRKSLAGRPIFKPALWTSAAVKGSNNCYSYANDLFTFTSGSHAAPGRSVQSPVVFGTCAKFRAAAVKDKLTPITTMPATGAPIALFIASDETDYHWYRQDRNGRWSHKPGGWPVRNCDEAGDAITDPRNADTLDYTFCSFFKSSAAARAVIT